VNRIERSPTEEEILRAAFRGMQSRIWTAIPGIVERFDAAKMIVDVQPAINGRARSTKGVVSSLQMPKLLDCPVLWQGGGGVTLTFPISAGDECLVIFSARCIDGWWEQGGIKDPPDIRMHNLSDGFALVGVRSVPRAFAVSTTEAVLRSDDGSTYAKLNPDAQTIQMTAPGGINLNGVLIDSSGNVTSPATMTAVTDVVGGGKHLKTHTHSGVTAGASNTGQPT
jgi:hypothetical protein